MNIEALYKEIVLWHEKTELPENGSTIIIKAPEQTNLSKKYLIGVFDRLNSDYLADFSTFTVSFPDPQDKHKIYKHYYSWYSIGNKWAYLNEIEKYFN